MALVAAAVKSKMEDAIFAAMKLEFAKEMKSNKEAEKSYQRLAKAISEIATVMVDEIQTNAQVSLAASAGLCATPTSAGTTSYGPGSLNPFATIL